MFFLNLLPVEVFKQKLAKTMVTFYPMVAYNLVCTEDEHVIQRINERIVHISVQIFCNEQVVDSLVDEGNILAVFMACFKTLVGKSQEVTLGHPMIQKMQYWALASDLQNILHHPSAARNFTSDQYVFEDWVRLISGFNKSLLIQKRFDSHVEYDNPETTIQVMHSMDKWSKRYAKH